MTNATVIVCRTWASAHGRGQVAWAAACQHAYAMLRGSMTLAEQEVAEITMIEAQRVEAIHTWGCLDRCPLKHIEVMVWSTFAHIPGRLTVLRADVLDDLPRDEAMPSMRVSTDRPTPAPDTFGSALGTPD